MDKVWRCLSGLTAKAHKGDRLVSFFRVECGAFWQLLLMKVLADLCSARLSIPVFYLHVLES